MKAKILKSKHYILNDAKTIFGYPVLEVDDHYAYVEIDDKLAQAEFDCGRFEACEEVKKRGRKAKDQIDEINQDQEGAE